MANDPEATPLLRHGHPDLPIVILGGPAHSPARMPATGPAPIPTPAEPPKPSLSGLQRFAILTFSVLRILRGLSFIVYPALSVDSLDMPESPSNTLILGGLLGVRDLLLGGLLYTADERHGGDREVRRALVVNLLSDAMDTFILIFSAACSADWEHRAAAIAAVAVLALLEHLTLFSMGDDEELEMLMVARGRPAGAVEAYGYNTMLLDSHDRKSRLETWLTEVRLADGEASCSVSEEQREYAV